MEESLTIKEYMEYKGKCEKEILEAIRNFENNTKITVCDISTLIVDSKYIHPKVASIKIKTNIDS